MKPRLILLVSVLFFAQAETVRAAACCGGSFAAPSIIAGDDKAQLTTALSFTDVKVDNVDSQGVWREWPDSQTVQAFRLEGAHLLSDRWQVGFTLPILQRSYLGKNHFGIGDVSMSLGYEYLPDWNYNPWRPKGIGFLQLTLPTGRSRAESEIGGLDSRGNGFLAVGIGTLLTKTLGQYDVFSSLEVHRSFAKSYSTSIASGSLDPAYGGSFAIGLGYSLKQFRAGSSLTWNYEDPIEVTGTLNSKGTLERFATGTFSLSYLYSEEWAGTLSYSDQTLFGSPLNTSLGRTIALNLQRRWAR